MLVLPDTVTGDIVIVLEQKEHPKFKRKGDDLFVEHTLSLTEALCGSQFVLTHLDARQLLIKFQPGEVVKPDQFKEINDEGMPMYQRPFMKGKLYIHVGGAGSGSSRGRGQRRGEDVIYPLKVTLEDLYNGKSKRLSLSRNILCSKCNGLTPSQET
ncbi:hypothetical protein IFM89_006216 [Coptis chinensis]|uniref:Chaperone DnaJ C-terminal domain-containing protein n=1 Tax=Coptis chinensis TaxID=261450 RepID=A0A835HBE5_9MAGN|nr:hypothetical protein IFM89_006216 [Coptis chinensis]